MPPFFVSVTDGPYDFRNPYQRGAKERWYSSSQNGTTPNFPASLWRQAGRHLNDLHVCKDLTDLHPDNGPDLKDIGQATGGEKLRHVYVYAALGIHIKSRNKFKVLQCQCSRIRIPGHSSNTSSTTANRSAWQSSNLFTRIKSSTEKYVFSASST